MDSHGDAMKVAEWLAKGARGHPRVPIHVYADFLLRPLDKESMDGALALFIILHSAPSTRKVANKWLRRVDAHGGFGYHLDHAYRWGGREVITDPARASDVLRMCTQAHPMVRLAMDVKRKRRNNGGGPPKKRQWGAPRQEEEEEEEEEESSGPYEGKLYMATDSDEPSEDPTNIRDAETLSVSDDERPELALVVPPKGSFYPDEEEEEEEEEQAGPAPQTPPGEFSSPGELPLAPKTPPRIAPVILHVMPPTFQPETVSTNSTVAQPINSQIARFTKDAEPIAEEPRTLPETYKVRRKNPERTMREFESLGKEELDYAAIERIYSSIYYSGYPNFVGLLDGLHTRSGDRDIDSANIVYKLLHSLETSLIRTHMWPSDKPMWAVGRDGYLFSDIPFVLLPPHNMETDRKKYRDDIHDLDYILNWFLSYEPRNATIGRRFATTVSMVYALKELYGIASAVNYREPQFDVFIQQVTVNKPYIESMEQEIVKLFEPLRQRRVQPLVGLEPVTMVVACILIPLAAGVKAAGYVPTFVADAIMLLTSQENAFMAETLKSLYADRNVQVRFDREYVATMISHACDPALYSVYIDPNTRDTEQEDLFVELLNRIRAAILVIETSAQRVDSRFWPIWIRTLLAFPYNDDVAHQGQAVSLSGIIDDVIALVKGIWNPDKQHPYRVVLRALTRSGASADQSEPELVD